MHGCRPCDFDVCDRCYETYAREQPGNSSNSQPRVSSVPPQAKFVSDVTMTDGCVVKPGENLIKVWRVRNSGTEAWPVGVRIAHVGGNSFGGPAAGVEVPRANPGEAVNVSVPLIMPSEPGRHTSYWRMITPFPANTKFGHRFWVTVNVVPPPPPEPVNVPSAPLMSHEYIRYGSAPPASSVIVEPNVAEQPVVDSSLEVPVAQITELGFSDIDKIVSILREENGDTARAVERLLAEQ